jgi:hypothetical protein
VSRLRPTCAPPSTNNARGESSCPRSLKASQRTNERAVAFYQAPDRHAYKSGNAVSWCQLLQVKENGSGQAWTQNSWLSCQRRNLKRVSFSSPWEREREYGKSKKSICASETSRSACRNFIQFALSLKARLVHIQASEQRVQVPTQKDFCTNLFSVRPAGVVWAR